MRYHLRLNVNCNSIEITEAICTKNNGKWPALTIFSWRGQSIKLKENIKVQMRFKSNQILCSLSSHSIFLTGNVSRGLTIKEAFMFMKGRVSSNISLLIRILIQMQRINNQHIDQTTLCCMLQKMINWTP